MGSGKKDGIKEEWIHAYGMKFKPSRDKFLDSWKLIGRNRKIVENPLFNHQRYLEMALRKNSRVCSIKFLLIFNV